MIAIPTYIYVILVQVFIFIFYIVGLYVAHKVSSQICTPESTLCLARPDAMQQTLNAKRFLDKPGQSFLSVNDTLEH